MLFAVIVEPEGQRIRREREVLGQVEPGGKGVGEHVGQREGFTFSLATVNGKVKTSGKAVVTEQGKPVTDDEYDGAPNDNMNHPARWVPRPELL
jgi:hypothetical protein